MRGISRLAEIIAAILLAAMCCLVFTNVVCRYLLHFSIPWSEEISRFLQIWTVFLGTALVYKENGHMGMDVLVKKFPPQLARFIAILVDVIIIFLTYLIGRGGLQLTLSMRAWTAPASGLSYSWKFAIVVFSMVLMLIFALDKLFWHVLSLIKNQDLSDETENGTQGVNEL
jgi:TRAP-type C4-dicarboxylate transport system, small permease component